LAKDVSASFSGVHAACLVSACPKAAETAPEGAAALRARRACDPVFYKSPGAPGEETALVSAVSMRRERHLSRKTILVSSSLSSTSIGEL
jgi:hypothetical protein